MIKVTRFDGSEYYINPHLIESLEGNPDTTISIMPSKKILVKDTIDEVIERIVAYRRSVGVAISESEGNSIVLRGEDK